MWDKGLGEYVLVEKLEELGPVVADEFVGSAVLFGVFIIFLFYLRGISWIFSVEHPGRRGYSAAD